MHCIYSAMREKETSGTYKTTRPVLPPIGLRKVIRTKAASSKGRFTIEMRPLLETDLNDLHRLRTQYEVMRWTSTGRCDVDIDFTKTWMARFMPPNDLTTFNFCLFVCDEDAVFEHAGIIGCHITSPVANIGYMLRREWWGKGIATASLQAFLETWWTLERKEVDLDLASRKCTELEVTKVCDSHVQDAVNEVMKEQDIVADTEKDPMVPEVVFAEIESSNEGSRKVLERCCFQFRGHEEIDENGQLVGLDYYTLTKP